MSTNSARDAACDTSPDKFLSNLAERLNAYMFKNSELLNESYNRIESIHENIQEARDEVEKAALLAEARTASLVKRTQVVKDAVRNFGKVIDQDVSSLVQTRSPPQEFYGTEKGSVVMDEDEQDRTSSGLAKILHSSPLEETQVDTEMEMEMNQQVSRSLLLVNITNCYTYQSCDNCQANHIFPLYSISMICVIFDAISATSR
jgi:hypothetical protein